MHLFCFSRNVHIDVLDGIKSIARAGNVHSGSYIIQFPVSGFRIPFSGIRNPVFGGTCIRWIPLMPAHFSGLWGIFNIENDVFFSKDYTNATLRRECGFYMTHAH